MDGQTPISSSNGLGTSYHPDWYPDPTRRFEFRYHNGHDWTGDVSTNGNRFVDALPPPPDPRAANSPRTKSPGSGLAVAAFVLGLSSIVVGWVPFLAFLAVVAAVLAVIFALRVFARSRRIATATTSPTTTPTTESSRSRGFTTAALILAPFGLAASALGIWFTTLVIREVNDYTDIGAYTVQPANCTVEDGTVRFDGTISNQSAASHVYRLEVEFVRPSTDNVLHRAAVQTPKIAAGDHYDWAVSLPVAEDSLDCRVVTVSGPLPFGD